MQPVSAIALSGMTAATSSLGSSAHNIANLGTAGFKRQLASQEALEGGGVVTRFDRAVAPGSAIEADMVGLLSAKNAFLANLAVFRASDAQSGVLLDIVA
jgi:flagellar basal body rod protein FlgC